MSRRDRYILLAIAIAFIAAAVWAGVASAQSGLLVPGQLTASGDAAITDDLTVGGTSTVTGLHTWSHYSNSYLPQRVLIIFNEASYGGKAFPDTICGMGKRLFFVAPTDGLLYDVYFGMEDNGSGWDSLKVDVFNGVGADTSVFTTAPMLIPADGPEASTRTSGRQAVMDGTTWYLSAGERAEISATTYGNCATGPTGLMVFGWFQPDYGN